MNCLPTHASAGNLTLRAVQEAVGISNAYLSQLETAKVQSPSPVVLHKLSELYDLPYATVMELAGYPIPQNVRRAARTTGSRRESEKQRLKKKIRL